MGHSSMDTHSIDRAKYQEVFGAVLKYMGFSSYGQFEETQISDDFDREIESKIDKYGKYENETFSIFPYWWGDCECDYLNWSAMWARVHEHESRCYQTELRILEKEHKKIAKDTFGFMDTQVVKDLLNYHNLPKQGCAVHCDCTYDMNWENALMERGETHTKECPMTFPNFYYKPTDLRIEWYKYPFRDSYSNRKFTAEEFLEMMTSCIEAFYK